VTVDDETSTETEADPTQWQWQSDTVDFDGRRSPLRRGLLLAIAFVALAAAGACLGGVIAIVHNKSSATTSATVAPATTTAPTTLAPTPVPETVPVAATPTAPTTTAAPATPTTAAPAPAPARIVVTVDGTIRWTDSGIDLAAGDAIDVEASGVVAHNVFDPASRVGPDGDPRPELAVFNLVTDGMRLEGRHCALTGRIGDGPPFVIGSSAHIVANAPGRLYLGVDDNGLDNNAGDFDAALTRAGVD
jgi:hypothetical protein